MPEPQNLINQEYVLMSYSFFNVANLTILPLSVKYTP